MGDNNFFLNKSPANKTPVENLNQKIIESEDSFYRAYDDALNAIEGVNFSVKVFEKEKNKQITNEEFLELLGNANIRNFKDYIKVKFDQSISDDFLNQHPYIKTIIEEFDEIAKKFSMVKTKEEFFDVIKDFNSLDEGEKYEE